MSDCVCKLLSGICACYCKSKSVLPILIAVVLCILCSSLVPGTVYTLAFSRFRITVLYTVELEFTILDVIIETDKSTHNYFLYDETNLKEGTSSMARTTGYTASATVDILSQNIFNEKGVFPPEIVGSKPKVVDYLMNHLKRKDVLLKKII